MYSLKVIFPSGSQKYLKQEYVNGTLEKRTVITDKFCGLSDTRSDVYRTIGHIRKHMIADIGHCPLTFVVGGE